MQNPNQRIAVVGKIIYILKPAIFRTGNLMQNGDLEIGTRID